jgi:CDGSH-type Zn-finger protein
MKSSDMSKGNVADNKPVVMEVAAGTYYWCSCGNSKGQPFCDGSHKGSEFRPQQVVLDKPTKMALCNCKQTENAPCCDGSHCKL